MGGDPNGGDMYDFREWMWDQQGKSKQFREDFKKKYNERNGIKTATSDSEAQALKLEDKLAEEALQKQKDDAEAKAKLKLTEDQKLEELNSTEDITPPETASSGSATLGNQFYTSLFTNSALYSSKQIRPK
ncbi:hypothetical protein UFOVP1192_70 [uncultured Caudovirales phage]|uniref:Uncharacterized protein n=1 Tax=uncultured Caudovirales phage TaxID=2100421 RepID=A0A6J5R810_9CAUD|nr:hypothetical protein UFOVP1192_70 [uncultured Caudovirales phage]